MNKKFTNFLDGILHASDIAENKSRLVDDSENQIGIEVDKSTKT